MDTISTFWENPHLRRITGEYVRAQSSLATYRLFVFSNADNAHKYGHLLEAHYRQYGKTGGGVFLCSLDSYRRAILPKIAERSDNRELLSTDFALLTYDSDNGAKEVLEATLDQNEFNLKLQNVDHALVHQVAFRRMFDELKELNDGQVNRTYGVVRWHPAFVSSEPSDRAHWANILEGMFGGRRHGDIYHMVFFSNLRPEDVRHVIDVKNRILQIKKSLEASDRDASPVDIWFGSRITVGANDSLGAGPIDVGSAEDAPYVLTMRFPSADGLKKYYEDHEHSDARRTLYESLKPEMKPLYELIEHYPANVKSAIWNVINRIAKGWIERRDYVDNEECKFIVQKPIPRFED